MTDMGMTSETDTNREAGNSVAADLKAVAGQKLDQAMAGVKAKAEDAKASVAGEVQNMASVLRNAADEMRGGSPQERSIAFVADHLADASDALRDKDMGEILHGITRVARQNPILFLGGAALLGFAASRYLKASDTGVSGGSVHGGSGYAGGTGYSAGGTGYGYSSGSGAMDDRSGSSYREDDESTSIGMGNDDLDEGKPNDPSVSVFP
ncbi:hypothetical protein [Tabrizicola sp. BL-A-41-H6]|uniref:hypothetical protein n=1 Tax=Tabrizicola sp. BL-A-41-H6 TaxID=3421107 RepID=UPI003D67AE48